MVKVRFENQVLEVQKSEKLTFEVSILVKKLKIVFLMHAPAIGDKFCSGYQQNMLKKLFKLIRKSFEKQVSEVRKSKKKNA